jgi:NAD(P)-dependent dehydrogenase (short-subunit alcohol dehydrogenase family)
MGRVVLITGATDGLGRALAAELIASGHTVLAHGRDPERLRTIGAARTYLADLSSLTEVRRLADELLAGEPRIDVLVNNAGIGFTLPGDGVRMESADGIELRFAVNYLAGYLLTRQLLGRLVESAPARIVSVASAGQAPIDFDDAMLERDYDGVRAYCQSKLAQILLTRDLADELAGTGATATAVHPGSYMPTKIVEHAQIEPIDTLASGVAAVARLAVDPALDGVSGAYFERTREAAPHPQADDADARRRLRELSRELTGV